MAETSVDTVETTGTVETVGTVGTIGTDETDSKPKNADVETDFSVPIPQLNVNKFTTTQSLAQGCLDLALLSANAAQLKYILSEGNQHSYYSLLMWIVSLSIILQVLQAVVCIILGLIFDITKVDDQKRAEIINNVALLIAVIIVALNVVISAFDIKSSSEK